MVHWELRVDLRSKIIIPVTCNLFSLAWRARRQDVSSIGSLEGVKQAVDADLRSPTVPGTTFNTPNAGPPASDGPVTLPPCEGRDR